MVATVLMTREGMTPSRVSATLRAIADKIERSSNPSRVRVISAVRRVLAGMKTQDFDLMLDRGWGNQEVNSFWPDGGE